MNLRCLPLLLLLACSGKNAEHDDDDDGIGPRPTDVCDGHPSSVICIDGVAVVCSPAEDVTLEEDCAAANEICIDDGGCASCAIDLAVGGSAESAEDDVSAFVEVRSSTPETFGWEKYHMRPVTVTAPDEMLTEGTVNLSLSGTGFTWLTTEGDTLSEEISLDLADLPYEFLASSSAVGTASASASYTTCEDQGDTVTLRSGHQPPLTGHPLSGFPHVERVQVFTTDEVVRTALDPVRHADRIGQPYTVSIVNRKTPTEWAADPSIDDVSMGVSENAIVQAGSTADNIVDAWTSSLTADTDGDRAFDVVLDFNENLRLDPGDIVQGPGDDTPGLVLVGDLTISGPHLTSVINFGESHWRNQRVYYPSDIAIIDPAPLVVISHGNGHDYTWYDYLGYHLASYGYVVMTHRNQTGPGIETAAQTTLDNTDYFIASLPSLEGGVLDGRVDSSRIAWIGHSRGGEGVVYAYDQIIDGGYVPTQYTADDIRIISSIAPTVFYTVDITNPHDKAYHLFAGAADGDVHGSPANASVQFFRILSAAQSSKQSTYLHGVGHNEFNCCGFADASGPDLIGRTETQAIAKSYYLALMRVYLDGDAPYLDFFRRRADVFRPVGISETPVIVNSYRPDPIDSARVIDDFQTSELVSVSDIGEAVEFTVTNPYEELLKDANGSLSWAETDPMNGMTQASSDHDTNRGLVFDWASPASVTWTMPPTARDVTPYAWLTFRAAQGTQHPNTLELNAPLDFTVVLVDGAGSESEIRFGEMGQISAPYSRLGGYSNEFNTIRLRLTDFTADGASLDLTDIAQIRLDFGGEFGDVSGSPMGRLGFDDLLLEY